MFCVRCGKKLPGDFNKCRKCPDTARSGAWYCPHCGNGVKSTQKKCDVCGGELSLSPETYVMPEATDPKSRLTAVILAFLLGFTGLHFYYLKFPSRFRKRLIWAVVSILFSIACLITFQTGMEQAFPGGEYDAAIAESLTGFAVSTAIGIVAGGLSFVLSWTAGVIDGIVLLRKPKYQDGNGTYLE